MKYVINKKVAGIESITLIKLGAVESTDFDMHVFVNPRPAGGGAQRAPPCGFSQIAPEVLGISL